jgi:hypothetical protein
MILIFFVIKDYLILIFIRCFVETMHWNKRLFTHPWPAMYMYFYTKQQNRCLRVNALQLS